MESSARWKDFTIFHKLSKQADSIGKDDLERCFDSILERVTWVAGGSISPSKKKTKNIGSASTWISTQQGVMRHQAFPPAHFLAGPLLQYLDFQDLKDKS